MDGSCRAELGVVSACTRDDALCAGLQPARPRLLVVAAAARSTSGPRLPLPDHPPCLSSSPTSNIHRPTETDGHELLHCTTAACRYPVVAKMAKNFLTIPATSVSSESTFSTGGRVLDDYRSSLKPSMVVALVCASSWIKGAHNDNGNSMNMAADDDDDDVESIPFPKSVVGSN
ncbi:hypothetical protein QYE76_027371 [Lolium multiflorum]|uniref:HAT C-terminal dimerisation domain-containing protein n=1 Tax=Lolium multiflorum TaxID=4521 RepID=A0AAD8QJ05_LOLMU|nr:hypothetical protein QYE76_027371 [Lolium multiflorum]